MYITYSLLAVTILISVKAFDDESWKRRLMLNPYDVVHHKKWYRTFTHAFIHADFAHLFFNMYVLYLFGEFLEERFIAEYGLRGYMLYALLYLSAILFSSIFSIAKHKDNIHYNSLGASGAVSAVLFAYIVVNPMAELGLLILPIFVPAYIFGPIILFVEYLLAKRGGTGIAHDAHIAGAIYGIVFMLILNYNYLFEFIDQFKV